MDATTIRINGIFGLNNTLDRYEIPKYQRGYSWTSEQIEYFWDDLKTTDKLLSNDTHFFGTIYVAKEGDVIRIVDGQQRITTCALFLLCARDYLYPLKKTVLDAQQNFDDLERTLYQMDRQTRKPNHDKFILSLSRTNKEFFDSYIVPINTINNKSNIKDYASNDSNEHIADAYIKFSKLIKELFNDETKQINRDETKQINRDETKQINHDETKQINRDENGVRRLNSMIWTLHEKFKMIQVQVPDDTQAYDMFNLINNRGVQLADSDLIKNRLFAMLYTKFKNSDNREEQLDDYDQKWSEIRDNITGETKGNYTMDEFFHNYIIAFKPYNIKRSKIFETFQQLSEEAGSANTINDLLKWSRVFIHLRNPQTWFGKRSALQHYLEKIKSIKANYVYSVLLAGYAKMWHDDKPSFVKLAEVCFKYHLRAKTMAGVSLENYQNKLNVISKKITNDSISINSIICELVRDEESYPNNAKIDSHLATLKVTNSNVSIALLQEIERGYDEDKYSNSDITVEHIMPKSTKNWTEYILEQHSINSLDKVKEIHTKYQHWLGNQTLLGVAKNIKNSDKSFASKKEIYKKDSHKITKNLANYENWNSTAIKKRQEEFAKKLRGVLDLQKLCRKIEP